MDYLMTLPTGKTTNIALNWNFRHYSGIPVDYLRKNNTSTNFKIETTHKMTKNHKNMIQILLNQCKMPKLDEMRPSMASIFYNILM
jgi:hypothetical protein